MLPYRTEHNVNPLLFQVVAVVSIYDGTTVRSNCATPVPSHLEVKTPGDSGTHGALEHSQL